MLKENAHWMMETQGMEKKLHQACLDLEQRSGEITRLKENIRLVD